jgi:hypothetical protein
MINHNIHNSVVVCISENLNTYLFNSLKHQLHYFQTNSIPQHDSVFKILIYPFTECPEDNGTEETIFSGTSSCSSGIITVANGKNAFSYSSRNREITLYISADNFDVIPYIQLAFSSIGKSFLHAAAIDFKGDIFIFPSISGGVGKTALIGNLLKANPIFNMLGDDYIIVSSGGEVNAYPKPMFLYDYHSSIFRDTTIGVHEQLKIPSLSRKIKLAIKRVIPFRKSLKLFITTFIKNEYFNKIVLENQPYAQVLPEKVFGRDRISSSGKLRSIIQLQKYSGDELKMQKSESSGLINSMYSTIHFELREFWDPIYDFGRYDQMDMPEYYSNTRNVITSAVKDISAYTLFVPEKTNKIHSVEIAAFISKHIHNESV